ncbi:MAG: hypothetical protein Q7S13_02205 [Candidatus Omnitrophota bacterium]|jgi:uncharacterized membrane protein YhaH (DUF805 family)|nr:hypothetical protein [Candidatus Omnitrophota bacterium]
MGIVVSSEKENEWIEGEHRRQKYYWIITVLTFILLIHAFIQILNPENIFAPVYLIMFFYAFLAFMVTTLILTKSQRYLHNIDELLKERSGPIVLKPFRGGR